MLFSLSGYAQNTGVKCTFSETVYFNEEDTNLNCCARILTFPITGDKAGILDNTIGKKLDSLITTIRKRNVNIQQICVYGSAAPYESQSVAEQRAENVYTYLYLKLKGTLKDADLKRDTYSKYVSLKELVDYFNKSKQTGENSTFFYNCVKDGTDPFKKSSEYLDMGKLHSEIVAEFGRPFAYAKITVTAKENKETFSENWDKAMETAKKYTK